MLKVNKLNITCDLDNIIDQVKNWTYEESDYDGAGELFTDSDYSYSEEDWEKAKTEFISKLEQLKDDDKLIEALSNNVCVNKNGSITKRRNNVILQFKCVRNYNNSYGSHSYTIDALMVTRDDDFKGTLNLSSYGYQTSF